MKNQTAAYRIPFPEDIRADFDGELAQWVSNGWLFPYDEARLGPPHGLIPLMAVNQPNKQKTVVDAWLLERQVLRIEGAIEEERR